MTLPWPTLRRYAAIVAVMLIGMAVLWGLLWTITAAKYRNLVDTWMAAERAHGHELHYDLRATDGFPNAIVLRFVNLSWKDNAGGKAEAGDLTLSAHPWHWRVFKVAFQKNATLMVPFPEADDPLILRGASGDGHIELNEDDTWGFVRLRIDSADVSRPSRALFTAEELDLAAERPEWMPKDYTETGLSLSGRARNVMLKTKIPMPFGDKVASADLAFRIMGPPPNFYDRDSVIAWNNDNGIVECDAINLEWGPLSLATKGTLALNGELQPEGAFAGYIRGHEAVIQALLEQNWIAKHQAGMLSSALNLLAKPSTLDDQPSIEVPITVQMGGLFLGPVRLFTFPDIVWPSD